MSFLDLPEDIVNGDAGPRTSWAVGAYTGYKIHKQGTHTPLQMLNAALSWRIWTGVLSWWLGVWAVGTFIFIAGGLAWHAMPVAVPVVVINTVVVYLAMGLSFVRLCVLSQFRIRGPFKPCMRLATFVPNVAPTWLYLLPFLPLLWGLTAVEILTQLGYA